MIRGGVWYDNMYTWGGGLWYPMYVYLEGYGTICIYVYLGWRVMVPIWYVYLGWRVMVPYVVCIPVVEGYCTLCGMHTLGGGYD